MIARGSMVALKGHERVRMVVRSLVYLDRGHMSLPGQALDPHDGAICNWLSDDGMPQTEVYPLEMLVELDG